MFRSSLRQGLRFSCPALQLTKNPVYSIWLQATVAEMQLLNSETWWKKGPASTSVERGTAVLRVLAAQARQGASPRGNRPDSGEIFITGIGSIPNVALPQGSALSAKTSGVRWGPAQPMVTRHRASAPMIERKHANADKDPMPTRPGPARSTLAPGGAGLGAPRALVTDRQEQRR